MRVYISGAISNDVNYKQKFLSAAIHLESKGYQVFNPAILPGEMFEYEEIMDIDFAILKHCDCIYMLRDWQTSKGARREFEEASRRNLMLMFQ